MMAGEVEVEDQLAVRAAEVAASRGEELEDVVARALREYIRPTDPPRPDR